MTTRLPRVPTPDSRALPAEIDNLKHPPPLDSHREQSQVDPGVGPLLPVKGTLYTLPEAAVFLRVGENTLRQLVRSGAIPGELVTRIGARRQFMTGDAIRQVIDGGAPQLPPPPAPPPDRVVRRRKGVAA